VVCGRCAVRDGGAGADGGAAAGRAGGCDGAGAPAARGEARESSDVACNVATAFAGQVEKLLKHPPFQVGNFREQTPWICTQRRCACHDASLRGYAALASSGDEHRLLHRGRGVQW